MLPQHNMSAHLQVWHEGVGGRHERCEALQAATCHKGGSKGAAAREARKRDNGALYKAPVGAGEEGEHQHDGDRWQAIVSKVDHIFIAIVLAFKMPAKSTRGVVCWV